ncbi:MAG: DUF2970 domain-containing protein [Betaproteobacteria bacterium]|nr:DUF2970 domain-containing protein [Betaproteobacteria bacterium]MDE2124180.1 DUF2970 domain-containing protein [Betaproteobacteria bacterium]MDE2186921.1 DUF2970 domain-containing protein [Betaproteobacteria bacterium]MDE2323120.1 DUF2970 domain-containing protein [Betaproteobacteria bacterium]
MRKFLSAFKAIAWAFLGIRKSRDQENDFARLNIIHIVIAGLISAAIFIVILISIVHWVVHKSNP